MIVAVVAIIVFAFIGKKEETPDTTEYFNITLRKDGQVSFLEPRSFIGLDSNSSYDGDSGKQYLFHTLGTSSYFWLTSKKYWHIDGIPLVFCNLGDNGDYEPGKIYMLTVQRDSCSFGYSATSSYNAYMRQNYGTEY